jgi:lysophospholipase L1-like esterase
MVRGVCGELTGEMALRFRQDVLKHRPHSVVILGGTNDLGWNAAPADTMRNLLKMYEQALGADVRPVAVTVPSIRLEMGMDESQSFLADHLAQRRSLNTMISDYCERKGIPCVDLFSATAEEETLLLAACYSNDGLHLTTEGYALLADLLYEQVFATWFPSMERSQERSSRGTPRDS